MVALISRLALACGLVGVNQAFENRTLARFG